MTEPTPSPRETELQLKLDKLRRRQKRNERAVWADGYMTAICGMLRPGDIAIDLGANVGDVSAPLLATGADVIAFDPEPWAVEKLRARFADEPRYTLHNAAVGTHDGTITMFRANNFEDNQKMASVKSTILSGGRMIDYESDDQVQVRLINFVTFLQNLVSEGKSVAFLKMDIEGAELDLLQAMDDADLFAHIRCCVVETHERKFKDLRPAFRQLRADFAQKYAINHVNLDWI